MREITIKFKTKFGSKFQEEFFTDLIERQNRLLVAYANQKHKKNDIEMVMSRSPKHCHQESECN